MVSLQLLCIWPLTAPVHWWNLFQINSSNEAVLCLTTWVITFLWLYAQEILLLELLLLSCMWYVWISRTSSLHNISGRCQLLIIQLILLSEEKRYRKEDTMGYFLVMSRYTSESVIHIFPVCTYEGFILLQSFRFIATILFEIWIIIQWRTDRRTDRRTESEAYEPTVQ